MYNVIKWILKHPHFVIEIRNNVEQNRAEIEVIFDEENGASASITIEKRALKWKNKWAINHILDISEEEILKEIEKRGRDNVN